MEAGSLPPVLHTLTTVLCQQTSFICREELLARLKRLPGQIEAEDIPDLVTLAQVPPLKS
jgi:hypothetical protein